MISVIIPALNESRALPATLARLLAEPGPFETIVVDGGSDDDTVAIASAHAGVRVITAPRGRARQMNAGARSATGDLLLFLHADTLLPAGAMTRLRALAADPDCIAGGFRHRFSGEDWRLRAISAIDNWRCARTRIIYGDQAMFVRRAMFEHLGGFPEQPDPYLEDVRFCEALRRIARPVLLDETVVTDSRKFEKTGVWRAFARMSLVLACHRLGMRTRGLAFFDAVR